MVFVGIDTHKSSLAVCIVDELGRQLAVESFPNDPDGHRRLHVWVSEEAPGPRRFGIESSGWLGHGLSLYLLEQGEDVRDVRGHMTKRERVRLRGHGKSDPRDAFAIARVTAREQLAPVRTDSPARDLKLLSDYRDQLCSERTRTQNRLHADLVTLRPGYEQQLPSLATPPKLDAAERLLEHDDSVQAGLARRRIERIREIDAERRQVEREIRRLVARARHRTRRAGRRRRARRRPDHRRGRRHQPHPFEPALRLPERHRARPCLLRAAATPPAQPRRQPADEQGDPHDGAHPGPDGPARSRLRRPPPGRRPQPPRSRPARSSDTSPTSSTANSARTPSLASATTSDTDPRGA